MNVRKLCSRLCATAGATAAENQGLRTIFLVGVSRILEKPLSARVHGPSTSGKSYIISMVADLFPPETILLATQMTSQALYHMPSGSLIHRVIVSGERSRVENDDSAEASRALREMISSGRLSKLMLVKFGGQIVTKLIEQDGPIAFVESTTLAKVFNEDANRSLMLHTARTTREPAGGIGTQLLQAWTPGAGVAGRPQLRSSGRIKVCNWNA